MPTPEGQITSTETWMTPAQPETTPEVEQTTEETDTEPSDN